MEVGIYGFADVTGDPVTGRTISPRQRLHNLVEEFASTYPELFPSPRLVARLEVYEALWHLVQMHHWGPGQTWMTDPGGQEALLAGTF